MPVPWIMRTRGKARPGKRWSRIFGQVDFGLGFVYGAADEVDLGGACFLSPLLVTVTRTFFWRGYGVERFFIGAGVCRRRRATIVGYVVDA